MFKKYEFTDKATAQTRIAALPSQTDEDGNEYPAHSHTIVELGYLVKVDGTYDDEGNELTAPVLSDKYSVDVLWKASEITVEKEAAILDEDGNVITPAVTKIEYPYGWASKEVSYDESTWSNPNGAHTFFGLSFVS